MAEYCSKCKILPYADFSLFGIALKLKRGATENVICEGCNIKGLTKDHKGKLYLHKREVDGIKVLKVSLFSLL